MFVVWLDVVTYLHHHGPSDPEEEVPWYRNEEWSYFRGGLSTIDRDYGGCRGQLDGCTQGGRQPGSWQLDSGGASCGGTEWEAFRAG